MEVEHNTGIDRLKQQAEDHKNRGNDYFKRSQYSNAAEEYEKAIELCPNEPNYYGNRAACFLQMKKYKKCLKDCEKALSLDPNNAKFLRRKALSLQHLGLLTEAKPIFGQIVSLDNSEQSIKEHKQINELIYNLQQTQQKLDAKQYKEALYYMEKVAKEIPDAVDIQILNCECLARTGNANQAQEQLRLIQEKFGTRAESSYLKGLIELYGGNPDKAKSILQEGVRQDYNNKKCLLAFQMAKDSDNYKSKGNDCLNSNKFNEAIDYYTKALEVDSNNFKFNSIIYANRGLAYQKLKDHRKAVDDFDKSIELNDRYFKAYLRRGDSRQELGDLDGAQGDYQKVMELDQGSIQQMRQKINDITRKQKQLSKKDYYKILEVDKNASDTDIKKAYRKLALQWHPDKNKESEEQKKLADKKFREIAEAYSVLSDKQKRQQYDMGVDPNDPMGGAGGFETNIDPSQIFKMFFGSEGGADFGFGNMAGGEFPGGFKTVFTTNLGGMGQNMRGGQGFPFQFGDFSQQGGAGFSGFSFPGMQFTQQQQRRK
ncbi:unnamed protein product (macronuclear) [Paramecium tetraurelia]|uniref:J domain-containing protein n=1 Tax=Paramecium tetraurelia TaxID=5888 RepID=A0BJ69_PARTE|nr:uncharacterized protein GSPATT00004959001 [Paramecium tetraurelia]CAK58586.1 unnamed protein product [Paramecium tetraurelia]|eukprot:XP_001425984.1 hypothetical protein (macronuclear) [Paramecium tetraurelia strain d4-2]